MATCTVLALVGSLRSGSFNKKLVEASQGLAPEGMTIEIGSLEGIPVYNMDLEPNFPAEVLALAERVRAADGLLIATPEHNHSFSGVLKNALDWLSRLPGAGGLEGKPVIVQSASPGWMGGTRSQIALAPVLRYFEMPVQNFPEVAVGGVHKKFDEAGNLTDELARENITKQLAKFHATLTGG